jgi:hypothetical protein
MGTQQDGVIDIKGIMHIPGRMVLRDIEGLKIVIIKLYIRAFGNCEAKIDKN